MICKICEKTFKGRSGLSNHVVRMHSISSYDYLIKFDYGGVHPTCACGCGNVLRFFEFQFPRKYVNGHANSTSKKIKSICNVCAKTFKTYYGLDEHLKRKHDQVKINMNFCKCGCGEITKPFRKYINGHNMIVRSGPNERKFMHLLRARLRSTLKNECKVGSAVKDLGCSIEYLKIYLEKLFYPNPETGEIMTWDNHGYYGWHLDHIVPLSTFSLSIREEFLKAVHYTNLQPLWFNDHKKKTASENLKDIK